MLVPRRDALHTYSTATRHTELGEIPLRNKANGEKRVPMQALVLHEIGSEDRDKQCPWDKLGPSVWLHHPPVGNTAQQQFLGRAVANCPRGGWVEKGEVG